MNMSFKARAALTRPDRGLRHRRDAGAGRQTAFRHAGVPAQNPGRRGQGTEGRGTLSRTQILISFLYPALPDDRRRLRSRRQGRESYFGLDDANVKSIQARGQLPSPLPPYQLSVLDYAMGHGAVDRAGRSRRPDPAVDARQTAAQARPAASGGRIALHQSGDLNGPSKATARPSRSIRNLPPPSISAARRYAGLRLPQAEHRRSDQGDPHRAEVRGRPDGSRHPDVRKRQFRRRHQ